MIELDWPFFSGFFAFCRDLHAIDFISAIPDNKKQPIQGGAAYVQPTDPA